MSKVTTVRCDGDGCKKMRINDTNHWLIGVTKRGILQLTMMGDAVGNEENEKHFCGEHCASRWFLIEIGKLRG